MTRGRPALALLLALAGCGAAGPGTDPLDRAACRHLEIVDRDTGRSVRGIEDIAVDAAAGIAYLAADDRFAVEAAAREQRETLPQGGVYALSAEQVAAGWPSLRLADRARAFSAGHDLHPQGIDLERTGDGPVRLHMVNRRRLRTPDGGWRTAPVIETFELGAADAGMGTAAEDPAPPLLHRRRLEHPLICRPNDVAGLGDGRLLVSNDHGWCRPPGLWLEDALALRRANLVAVIASGSGGAPTARLAAAGIGFANGLAAAPGRPEVLAAATRERAVRVYDRADLLDAGAGPAEPRRRLGLEAAPDNLGWAPDGRLVVAVHPSLLRLAAYRKRWPGTKGAPSRVVALSLADGRREILYDDPDGRLLSAATTAAVLGSHLLVGSVADAGLVVCPYGAAAEGA